MGILNWFSSKSTPVDESDVKLDGSEGAITLDMAAKAASGEIKTSDAMKLETVFSCLRDKSESIGQLPVKMYRVKADRTVTPITSGREHRIFTQKPCDYMTMQGFLEMMVVSLETRGVFYAYIEKNTRGNLMSIIPFANQGQVLEQMDTNGTVFYTYTTNGGKYVDPYRASDLFIVKSYTLDGFTPVSPIVQNALLLSGSKAQEEAYNELQKNGITSQLAFLTDSVFTNKDAITRLKNSIKDLRGSGGVKKSPVFENGVKPFPLKLNPKDADLLNHREFTVNRICRIFRVPPERAGVSKNTGTKSDMGEINEAYMRDSLNPVIVKYENAMNQLTPDGVFVKVDRKAFYAGSPWRMTEAVEKEVKGGLASVNEGRIDLGRDPIEGGDVFAIDNNNVTYGHWNQLTEIQERIYNQQNQSSNGSANDKPEEEVTTDE